MGDQITSEVSGLLRYVPRNVFDRLLSKKTLNDVKLTQIFASLCRINTLYMIANAGSGHIGSSFSSLDIMSWIQLNEISNVSTTEISQQVKQKNMFFSSKGHDAPGLYSIWLGLGLLKFNYIHKLRRLDGLPGHPDISIPNVVTNTGSLGMGISKAKGLIFANRLLKKKEFVFVIVGDGELQEGQIWESLISASNNKLYELIVIVDHNKLQSDTLITKVSNLGDLEAKFRSFGWHVSRCDGNDIADFSETLAFAKKIPEIPKVIIADTIKGKGVQFMEHTSFDSDIELYKFHSGAPSEELYNYACDELINYANNLFETEGFGRVTIETIERPSVISSHKYERLIEAYSKAIIDNAKNNSQIVALNADLLLDTGLISFKEKFAERFIECGIAEQDMVSQAGAIALKGFLPIVHSFSCFLSSRPNEQIYNNASEKTKIIYIGSLAGLIPAGPGHSHQAVRDIASLGGIPGLIIFEPSSSEELRLLLDWAINTNNQSSYMRLVSIPVNLEYKLPVNYFPQLGKGVELTSGDDVIVITYGPILLNSAVKASNWLNLHKKIGVKVVNLPWLNRIDSKWLKETIGDIKKVVCLDNHYKIGGQGDRIAKEILLSNFANDIDFISLGLDDFPLCGTKKEILSDYCFDKDGIVNILLDFLNKNQR